MMKFVVGLGIGTVIGALLEHFLPVFINCSFG